MSKQLLFVQGEEEKIQIRGEINEQDIFWEQYQSAADMMERIVFTSKKEKAVEWGGLIRSYSLDYSNNIIAFCGERGDGKSSAMMSFVHELINNKRRGNSTLFFQKENINSTDFIDVIYVDPTALDHVHNVLDIILSQLFKKFKNRYDNQTWEEQNSNVDNLVDSFQRVYKILSIIKDSETILQEEFDASGSLAKLEKLSESAVLKEEIRSLLKYYGLYMSNSENATKMIIVAVDDLDLSLTHAYKMAEQIRKYLIIPEIVVIMALRDSQLNLAVQENNIRQLQNLVKLNGESRIAYEIQEMAHQYVMKFIPFTHRIFLPKIRDLNDVEIVFKDVSGVVKKEKIQHTISDAILILIYRKTGMVFFTGEDGYSMVLPRNLRGVVNLLSILYSMKTPEGWKDYKTKRKNIEVFFYEYTKSILQALPVLSGEDDFARKIQKLGSCKNSQNLHRESARILQSIDLKYYSLWGENTKNWRINQWRDIALKTNMGMHSLNFVVQWLNMMISESYGYEVREQLCAISTIYTIRANIALAESRIFEQNINSFLYYTNSCIWMDLLNNLMPSIADFNVSRVRTSVPSAKIFNCIADEIKLKKDYRLAEDTNMRVKPFRDQNATERKKFIITWILMGLLTNEYYVNKNVPDYAVNKEQYANGVYVFSNFIMNPNKHVALENYFIKPALLDSLYGTLNIGVLDISMDEFKDVVNDLKKFNHKTCVISEIITANIDLIMMFPKVIFGEYKSNAESRTKRTEELVVNIFEKICSKLKTLNINDAYIESLNVDDLRFLRVGEKDYECIDIAHMYAVLLEQACVVRMRNSVRDSDLEKKVQKLRDVLELKNIKGRGRISDYSDGTNKTTKWKNLRINVERMAKAIAMYLYLSKDYDFLSVENKEKLCNYYYQIIEQEKKDKNGIASKNMRDEYQFFTRVYSVDSLRERIDSILKMKKSDR